jgi:hypothetical protein
VSSEPTPGGPFRRLRPTALLVAVYGTLAVAWALAGAAWWGGRWFAVHLFTLGVVTNAVLAMSDHFSRTLTHRPGAAPLWQPVAANAAVVSILYGIPRADDLVIAIGATALTVVVVASYLRLRRMRKAAVAARFAWIVRVYERAHGAFVHGALLGALIGAGVLSGRWYGSARLAHLHVNLLGWGGLTLLATLVFFGPTIAHARIVEGADARAARALRLGATSLTVGVVALLLTGFDGAVGTAFRLGAAAALAVFAWSVAVVCRDVARAVRRSDRAVGMLACSIWFPVVAVADVVVVATGAYRFIDAIGLALLTGVLAQAILASMGYLAPFLRPAGPARNRMRELVGSWPLGRAAVWNVGVASVATAACLSDAAGAVLARVGWTALAAAVAVQIATTVAGVVPRSVTAAR